MFDILRGFPNEILKNFFGNYMMKTESMQFIHQLVHEGRMYTANHLSKVVANDGFIRLYVKSGATSETHIEFTVSTEGKAYLKTISAPTIVTPGTLPDNINLTLFNRKGGTNGPNAEVRYGTTYTGGTLRGNKVVLGGTGGQSVGSSTGTRIESVILPGEDIIIEMQNVSGQAKDMEIDIDFYEVTYG